MYLYSGKQCFAYGTAPLLVSSVRFGIFHDRSNINKLMVSASACKIVGFTMGLCEIDPFRSSALPFLPLDPGWVKKSRSDYGMNILVNIWESWETNFWVKFMMRIWNLSDPGSWMVKFASGINIPDPQHWFGLSFWLFVFNICLSTFQFETKKNYDGSIQ